MKKSKAKRGYQLNFSDTNSYVFSLSNRRKKAKSIQAALTAELQNIDKLRVLNVGGGAGAIDYSLSPFVKEIYSMDIDCSSVKYGSKNFQADNLNYIVADGMSLPFLDESMDIVICSHVYEHVPNSAILMSEIFRVLRPDGCCYFAAGNKIQIMEPHYKLPFLSVLPKVLADWYMRLAGKGAEYYEKHLTLSGLRRLTSNFLIVDYTEKIIFDPELFHSEYMVRPGSFKQAVAKSIFKYFRWFFPGFIWILKKP